MTREPGNGTLSQQQRKRAGEAAVDRRVPKFNVMRGLRCLHLSSRRTLAYVPSARERLPHAGASSCHVCCWMSAAVRRSPTTHGSGTHCSPGGAVMSECRAQRVLPSAAGREGRAARVVALCRCLPARSTGDDGRHPRMWMWICCVYHTRARSITVPLHMTDPQRGRMCMSRIDGAATDDGTLSDGGSATAAD